MKRVIISADDFGYSESVNQAIILAHQDGILTSAGLMVTGEACDSAVQLAKENPKLAVGLHVVLICGKSVLPHSEIPDLVNEDRNFSNSPSLAGLQYYFDGKSRKQLEKEIRAQFLKFQETGLSCSHVDSHLHQHINPAVFDILLKVAKEFGINTIRIPEDDISLSLEVDKSHYFRKRTHHFIFRRLSRHAKEKAKRHGVKFVNRVYGLFQTGDMNWEYTEHLIRNLPEGISEIYYHPDFESWYDSNQDHRVLAGVASFKFNQELETLLNHKIRELISQDGIKLTNFKDL